MKFAALLAVSLLVVTNLAAQESEEPSRGPDGGTQVHVTGIQILPVSGKPFSGVDSVDWTRNLEDGTVVATHLDAKLARDSQGRIYRERVRFAAANSNEPAKLREIILLDPVSHTRTNCVVAARHCTVTDYHAPTSFSPLPPGSFDRGKRILTRESLGSDVIDGLNVVGTRETVTINAGVVGNNQPLVSTREFWYSPDLQVNLSVTRNDPREGTQAIRVTNLSSSEPDPAMFQIPAGFVTKDVRGAEKAQN